MGLARRSAPLAPARARWPPPRSSPRAPRSVDPAFAVTEAPLTGLPARGGGALPIYLVLGNHDVGLTGARCVRPELARAEAERRRACVSVAHRGPAWTMPARHFVMRRGRAGR